MGFRAREQVGLEPLGVEGVPLLPGHEGPTEGVGVPSASGGGRQEGL
jgi:hypothetical protein